MQSIGVSLLLVCALTGQLVTGFVPALLHHLKREDIQQFGECSLKQAQDIFVDYPEQCNSAFSDLRAEIKSGSKDQLIYQGLYRELCSQECLRQIRTFSQECVAPQITDSILHACEHNPVSGDFCLIGVYKNNGTRAATKCKSAVATDQCSEKCRDSLTELREDLGCCVNALFNVTTYGLDKLHVADYKLWELCEVEEVEQCGNSPLAALLFSGAPTQQLSITLVTFMLSLIVWLSF